MDVSDVRWKRVGMWGGGAPRNSSKGHKEEGAFSDWRQVDAVAGAACVAQVGGGEELLVGAVGHATKRQVVQQKRVLAQRVGTVLRALRAR